ncbi:PREDICTED: speckle targeted PIP5K1A-regulated poly(A) polymerase-like [Dufourea novaeangliae]|uniref:Speckle targeted PIP5K1A-regulated poly(A) polymerase n=1 Tax=Dufourea novaeangliae TaxID=178035 RepID=A0A154P8A7_DUFNO|nr:PREDICTED: speckle targeted PIP5K1A-regulated poly(A) polymerase-like [Dufourea novaeangliae]KZC07574.1 Speckle targeted PIP5K1A-regulated poly(A) polymerase [Dufourea novaeangliae]
MSKQCDVCSMTFQDEYALQGHLGGKKHLKRVEQSEVIKRSIFVSPLPKFISACDLIDFFQKYGPIKWHKFSNNYLIIEFANRNSTEAVLRKPVWINNVKLNVNRRILHTHIKKPKSIKQNSPIENAGLISYNNIKHIFEKNTIFDNQLVRFLNAIKLTDAEIEMRYDSVCTQLDKIFEVVFPNCKTYKFGSTQTGLGFKECDLDIYMDIGEPISESTNASADTWTMQKIFREVKKIMFRQNCVFSNIVMIPRAKTPIIKFCYIRSNVSCDISFKNSLGIYKTHLIKYCMSLDSRVGPLMILIKYWARNFKISCTGKLSNYGLVSLIIFYLQQPSVKIIPPLLEFQKDCQPQIINGWQVNFNENIEFPPVTNKSSIPQLLHGFFFFYASFEYKCHIICPLDAKIYTESEFKNVENLPRYMDRYKTYVKEDENFKFKQNTAICLQDPIELNHNVTASIQSSTLNTFVQYCTIGAEICTETSKNDYKDLLKLLFSTVIKKKVTGSTFKVKISASQFKYNKETNNAETRTDGTKELKHTENDWCFTVFNLVQNIFEKVFKIKVEVLPGNVEAKQQKLETSSNVHTEKYQKVTLHCTGSHCVWRNRKINNVVLDPSLNCLEKEALFSEKTIENSEKEQSTNRINLDFTCTFEKQAHPLSVTLTVNNKKSDDHIFKEFAYFAKRKLLEIIKQTLTYMQQYNKCY